MKQEESIAIYILAGGKSSRMGADKALLMLGKKPIIQHLLDMSLGITNQVFILTNNPKYASFGIELVPDIILDIGPAGGIDAMLQHTKASYNVVLGCDMPFVDAESIYTLCHKARGYEITYSILNVFPEMMLSVFHQQCKTRWRELIEKEVYKLSKLSLFFTTNALSELELFNRNENLYLNVNEPIDYEKALNLMPLDPNLNGQDFIKLLQHPHIQVVDVRNAEERPKLSFINHRLIPMSNLEGELPLLNPLSPTIFVCHAAIRSELAMELAIEKFDFRFVYHLQGGLLKHSEELGLSTVE